MLFSFKGDGLTENRVSKEPEEKLYGRVKENSPLKNNSSSYFSQLIYRHHSGYNIFHSQNTFLLSPLAVFPLCVVCWSWCTNAKSRSTTPTWPVTLGQSLTSLMLSREFPRVSWGDNPFLPASSLEGQAVQLKCLQRGQRDKQGIDWTWNLRHPL